MKALNLLRAVLVTVALAGPAGVQAAEIPRWPSEQKARLEAVESQVVKTNRRLFAARQHRDPGEIETLQKQAKLLQEERVALLRATGQLSD